jgi:hypothetical protein
MFTTAFWLGVLDRCVKSTATTALLLLVGNGPLNVLHTDWQSILGLTGGAAVVSVLTSLGSTPFGDRGTTSMIPGAR